MKVYTAEHGVGRLLVVVGGGRWVSGSVREKMILKMVMSESWKWCSPA